MEFHSILQHHLKVALMVAAKNNADTDRGRLAFNDQHIQQG